MSPRPLNTLFICSHNSARSILAECLLNHLGQGRFRAWSAGSQPSGAVQPLALQALRHLGLTADGLRSKDWSEFAAPGAPEMDLVITVCDRAAGETCPVWPGQPITAHWGVADPTQAQGDDVARERAYREGATVLKRRIELMLALPVAQLDRMALQREVLVIGTR